MGKRTRWARFLIAVGVILIGLAVAFSFSSAGVFFSVNFGDGIVDYNTMSKDQLKKNLAVEGNVYCVYGCVAESYTERTSNGTTLSTTTDSYFYLIPFGDDEDDVILIEIPAGKAIEDQIDALWEASYGYDDPDNLLEEGVAISGVVENNDEDIIPLFKEWCDDNDIDSASVNLMPYTINCRSNYEVRRSNFLLSLVFYAAFIVYVAIIVLVLVKKRGSRRAGGYDQSAYVGASSYQNNDNGQYFNSGSGSTDMYQSNVNNANNFPVQGQQTNGVSQNANSIPNYNSDSSSYGYGNSFGSNDNNNQ